MHRKFNCQTVVIPDKSRIRIIVEGREQQFLVSLDSRRATIYSDFELIVDSRFQGKYYPDEGEEFLHHHQG